MNRSSNSGGLGEGVYYAPEVYAGFLKRFLIIAIDLAVLLLAGVVLYIVWYAGGPGIDESVGWLLIFWFAISYVYLVFVEPSSIGTLGFILTGVKVVNLKGERPSFVRMSFRLSLWVWPVPPCD